MAPPRKDTRLLVICHEQDCDKPVHSRDLCQNHYKQLRRRERGLQKPGPKPDPTKPRSRHGAARMAEGTIRQYLVLGGTCPQGHELVEGNVYVYPRGDTQRVLCRRCNLGYANGQGRMVQYGITLDIYDKALAEQDYSCKACGVDFADTKVLTPHIDHDHSCCPGRRACGECFRGLLCDRCNKVLGLIKDDPAILQRLLDYIG